MRLVQRPRPEKLEERWADKAAAMLGYEVVRLSQPRATKQTPGIPDRIYAHPRQGVLVWAELKSAKGKPSPSQVAFHAMLRACGQVVVVGTADVVAKALAEALGGIVA